LALQQKLEVKDFDFRGVWFLAPADFNEYQFTDDVRFSFAAFSSGRFPGFPGTGSQVFLITVTAHDSRGARSAKSATLHVSSAEPFAAWPL
jgi:hypothetical protein